MSFRLQVTCVGHVIGAVVADTQLHAQRAAKAVSIQYEELQPIITIQVSHLCIGLPSTIHKCVNVEGKKFLGSHMTEFLLKISGMFTVVFTGGHRRRELLSANKKHPKWRPGGGI